METLEAQVLATDELSAAAQAYAKMSPTKDGVYNFNAAWVRLTEAAVRYTGAFQE